MGIKSTRNITEEHQQQHQMGEENSCTLLEDPSSYSPDTLNLSQDPEAADYWFECFKDLVNKFTIQAELSQKNDPTAKRRAAEFKADYLARLDSLSQENSSEEPLTIRRLLDLNEACLRLHGFVDPWLEQKALENEASIARLRDRLDEIDALKSEKKWIELVRGLLAGNIFDWGAQAVTEILENDKSFGLDEALAKIQARPWLIDELDGWLERLKGPPHKCAVIFVDNSGVDVVLGILPFARELLLRQTKVLLCANTEPSLNDITFRELENILEKCCCICDILREARDSRQLIVYGNGQKGPCLDMRTLSEDLCTAIQNNETDLLVIEGMGRALHTNLYAKFRCETLKLAVVKNKWLAKRLGGEMFSVICKYEKV